VTFSYERGTPVHMFRRINSDECTSGSNPSNDQKLVPVNFSLKSKIGGGTVETRKPLLDYKGTSLIIKSPPLDRRRVLDIGLL